MMPLDPTSVRMDFLRRVQTETEFAFQPVVAATDGRLLGYEALLRGWDRIGFGGATAVMDEAWRLDALLDAEIALRRKAIESFALGNRAADTVLFLNLDGRLRGSLDPSLMSTTTELARANGIEPKRLCFELTERFDPRGQISIEDLARAHRDAGCSFALDDFAESGAQMRLLFGQCLDYLKLDRFFVSGIAEDARRRSFVASIVRLAHTLGVPVVAKGVESSQDCAVCRSIGCDFVQGHFVSEPLSGEGALARTSFRVGAVAERAGSGSDAKSDWDDAGHIRNRLEHPQILYDDAPTRVLFDYFTHHSTSTFVPVLDRDGRFRGIIRDESVKSYLYAPFGRDLLNNPSVKGTLRDRLEPCPSADMHDTLSQILEIFAENPRQHGIAITEDGLYAGFLTSSTILTMLNEHKLAAAEEEKFTSLGTMVAGVAHEVNTPLGTAVTLNSAAAGRLAQLKVKMADKTATRADLEHYLDAANQAYTLIGANLERASRLISSFKDIAADQASEAPRQIALADYVNTLIEALRGQAPTGMEFVNRVDGGLVMLTRPGAIWQVIHGLVMNAVQHAYDGAAGRIEIAAAREGRGVGLSVRDFGKGIPDDVLPRIWDPFFTTHRGQGGTGLGLTVVYNAVRVRLRGQIKVSTEVGRGTIFTIQVPQSL